MGEHEDEKDLLLTETMKLSRKKLQKEMERQKNQKQKEQLQAMTEDKEVDTTTTTKNTNTFTMTKDENGQNTLISADGKIVNVNTAIPTLGISTKTSVKTHTKTTKK